MSSVKSSEIRSALAGAIRQLRHALDDTQDGMARRLGCTLSGYIQWEKGRRVPSGYWLLQLMALCPDTETRRLFEGQIKSYPVQPSPRSTQAKTASQGSSTTPEQRKQARAIAREAIEILFDLGQAGYRPADQKLKSFADQLNRIAGDFSRAFPQSK